MGHEVFIDSGIHVGVDWTAEIARRIEWCDFLIVLISRNTLDGEMICAEVRLAHQRLKSEGRPRILPIRVRYLGSLDYELGAFLDRIQFTQWDTPEDTGRVLKDLLTAASSKDNLHLKSPPAAEGAAGQALSVREPSAQKKIIQPERRYVTVVFLKLANYAIISQCLDVEDLEQVLQSYHNVCRRVVNEFEGHIVNQNSDEILVYFGYPHSHEDDPLRAVRSSLKILAELPRLNKKLLQDFSVSSEQPISLKISIHSGLVKLVGTGDGAVGDIKPVGQTLMFAGQLISLAKPNAVVVSADTYRHIKGGFTCLSLGFTNLERSPAHQKIYQVISDNTCRTRFDFRRTAGLTPLIGRKLEIDLLLERWSRSREGQGEVVQISGAPGIGKSRLVYDFKLLTHQDPHTLLECQCWEHNEHAAFRPFIDLLENLLEFSAADSAEQKLSKLEAVLTNYGFILSEALPLFVGLLSIPVDSLHLKIKQKTAKQRQKTMEAILALIFKVAEENSIIFIVEDLHWADPSTLELLSLFIRQAPSSHILFLFTFRTEFTPPWHTQSSYITPMNLVTLPQQQAKLMATNIAGGKVLPDEITEQLLASTDGVPLFIEEWTKVVLESRILEEREKSYELIGSTPKLDMPVTLHELLMVRLDRLGAAKEVAQIGATIGRQFSYELIRLVCPLRGKILREALDRLVTAEFLYSKGLPPKSFYLFKHSLIKDAAYNSLPKSKKIKLHEDIAQALTRKFRDIATAQPELLAYHYAAANLNEQAIDYLRRAGGKALDRFAIAEVIGHLNKALEILGTFPDSSERDAQELEIRITLGTALSAKCYASPEVEKCYSRALELSQRLTDSSHMFPILRGLWCCYAAQARLQLARDMAEQLLMLAVKEDSLAHLIEANRTLGVILLWAGEFALARQYLENGTALYAQQQERSNALIYGIDPGAVCLIYTAWSLLFTGYPEQAAKKKDEALALAEDTGHPFTQAFTYAFAAWFSQFSRDSCEAYKMATQAVKRASEFGFNQWLAWGHILQGWALAKRGTEEGLTQMQQGLVEARAYSIELGSSALLALHSEVYAQSGQIDQSMVKLDKALDFVNIRGEHFYEAELYRLKGELLLTHGRSAKGEAETLFRQALELAHRQGAKLFELRAVISLARLLNSQERTEEARKMLQGSYLWFTEGFETPDLRDAQDLLKLLS